ncbi:MAG: cytidylate kinase-like family protein [Propionicimonas sp.]|uniref:cytidylate kinase-like family protein n=1 Tax=Propionicimonas sp. TaxID=1955623 RepID=UPI002B1F4994|nr:cytidylate kinase-like family protein [Propionicimonas sp.]MEA4944619.1 cytidylate kinase-like family protein [Propionicimonas sp.]MEA5053090.1 cytidylate kinase-like family protein [Propionicimonas sp.]MEA5117905.1 cytidylate kinase-like family protein [Propionicimonas sp.]
MPAITISRQMGAKGPGIARALAAELGWDFADKDTVNKVIRQYGLIRLNEFYDAPPKIRELFKQDSQLTIEMMNQTIAAIAARGNTVIMLRGGFVVTRGLVDVLNVFIKAPLDVRVARIAKRDHLKPEEAAEKVRADDKNRRKFDRLYYDADWTDPDSYDLVVNTKNLTSAQAVEKIIEAYHALPSRSTDAPTAETLAIDPVLAATVEELWNPARP